MCYSSVKRSDERESDTVFFTSEKSGMTNQLASLARRDYFYLYAFWRVNLGMYIINQIITRRNWLLVTCEPGFKGFTPGVDNLLGSNPESG